MKSRARVGQTVAIMDMDAHEPTVLEYGQVVQVTRRGAVYRTVEPVKNFAPKSDLVETSRINQNRKTA